MVMCAYQTASDYKQTFKGTLTIPLVMASYFNLIFMNALEIWSKDTNFETRRIKYWNINQIPREGEYIQIDMKARKVEQVIYDLDNFKIVCVVV